MRAATAAALAQKASFRSIFEGGSVTHNFSFSKWMAITHSKDLHL
jgi:glutamate mutase epsilon subunit